MQRGLHFVGSERPNGLTFFGSLLKHCSPCQFAAILDGRKVGIARRIVDRLAVIPGAAGKAEIARDKLLAVNGVVHPTHGTGSKLRCARQRIDDIAINSTRKLRGIEIHMVQLFVATLELQRKHMPVIRIGRRIPVSRRTEPTVCESERLAIDTTDRIECTGNRILHLFSVHSTGNREVTVESVKRDPHVCKDIQVLVAVKSKLIGVVLRHRE